MSVRGFTRRRWSSTGWAASHSPPAWRYLGMWRTLLSREDSREVLLLWKMRRLMRRKTWKRSVRTVSISALGVLLVVRHIKDTRLIPIYKVSIWPISIPSCITEINTFSGYVVFVCYGHVIKVKRVGFIRGVFKDAASEKLMRLWWQIIDYWPLVLVSATLFANTLFYK